MMARLPLIARLLFGVVYAGGGVAGLLASMAENPEAPMPGAGGEFMSALWAVGYLWPLLKIVEIVAGVGLITGRFVPLALTLLAPITINIVGFHLFLAPEGVAIAAAILALHLYLAYTYRSSFTGVLNSAAKPG